MEVFQSRFKTGERRPGIKPSIFGSENGDKVSVDMQLTGTQTKELVLPMPGMPKIPASGKKVSLPKEPGTFTVKNGKLARLDVMTTPGGGLNGILSQRGVKMP
jgi:hypothetical protein